MQPIQNNIKVTSLLAGFAEVTLLQNVAVFNMEVSL